MNMALLILLFLMTNVVFGQLSGTPSNFNVDSFLNVKRNAPLGKLFPSFIASSENGTVSNELLKGKIVLINFWFEGCHPCLAEMEALNQLQQLLKDNKDFLFISFTWDNPETIKRIKEKYGVTFPVLRASKDECSKLNFGNGYPTSIILNRSGNIKYLHSGGSTDKEIAREFIMTTLLSEIKSEL